ncbi:MAG: PhoH family protein [Verrucomicrobiota bacterium]
MVEHRLEFESPHFLHGLFAEDLSLLRELETQLGLSVTTRDAWVLLAGEAKSVAAGVSAFGDLEGARRRGGTIDAKTFRYAVEAARQNMNARPASDDSSAESSDEITAGVADLFRYQLLGGSGKAPVTPRTANQLKYLEALESHDVVFGVGPAGTGKTYLAMAYALDLLKRREIDRIMLTRPAVEAGEALGFLPGALEEKVLPYLRPLYDAMNDMLSAAEAQRFAEKGLIEIAPLAYMRGRTLNRACVILDEAQNTSREQMLMFLTRLGEYSTCVVTGDPSQIDLRPRHKSGLLEALNLLRGIEGISFVKFEGSDVVRHPVVARIIEAYESGREEE